jgi:uncharacterized protein YyaL (SSP411 family)
VEGLYYTYTYDELESVLGRDTTLFCQYFQCTRAGNWEHGRNILFALDTVKNAAAQLEMDEHVLAESISQGLSQLKTFREKRVKPGLDDKYICSWNNLMLKALAESAIWLEKTTYAERASVLAENILKTFYKNNALKRIAKNDVVKIDAFLEDHATLIDGLISLYQAGFDEQHLLEAKIICEQTIEKFYRDEKGFFEFNASNTLITPKYDISDDVINSGNSIMAHNLWRLSWYFDQTGWREMASRMLDSVTPLLETSAPWYSNWARLQLIKEQGTEQIILSAEEALRNTRTLKDHYKIPNALFGFVGQETEIPLFRGKEYKGKNLLYPCRDFVCSEPVIFDT